MPRQKKPAGTAVDKRNGARASVLSPVLRAEKPDPPQALCTEARAQWDAYWEDPASGIQTKADRGVLLRWIDAVDRYLRLIGQADLEPIVTGSTGQPTENPLYKVADKALGTIERCEKQLGIGALNRAGLGIAVITERKSLADMNAKYGGGVDGYDDAPQEVEADPRLQIVEGELA